MTHQPHSTKRDRSRQPLAKDRVLTRKAARRAKSARLFLCLAFPPALMVC